MRLAATPAPPLASFLWFMMFAAAGLVGVLRMRYLQKKDAPDVIDVRLALVVSSVITVAALLLSLRELLRLLL